MSKAKYTFEIVSICEGGEHININIMRDGELFKSTMYSKEDIITGKYLTWDGIAPLLLAKIAKGADSQTLEGYMSAIQDTEILL